jgi:hypothetical protein
MVIRHREVGRRCGFLARGARIRFFLSYATKAIIQEAVVANRGKSNRGTGRPSFARRRRPPDDACGERRLRHVLFLYTDYYNRARTHLSLNKDAPAPRALQTVGCIRANLILGGLHHQYVRILISGNTKIGSTVRYLGIEVDDALAIAKQVDV